MMADAADPGEEFLRNAVSKWENENEERLTPGDAGGETLSGIEVRILSSQVKPPGQTIAAEARSYSEELKNLFGFKAPEAPSPSSPADVSK